MSFPALLNMNHFLDETRQGDFDKTKDLISENFMSNLKPGSWKKPPAK